VKRGNLDGGGYEVESLLKTEPNKDSSLEIPIRSKSILSAGCPTSSPSTSQRNSTSLQSTSERLIIEGHGISSSASAIAKLKLKLKPKSKEIVDIIFRNGHGTFDSKHHLSLIELNYSSLPEFFAIYSQKSGIPLESLDGLKLEVVLSGEDGIIATRGQDSQSWKSLKHDIARLITLAKSKNPEETRYEIRVDRCK
jgi:hypothetical protein